MFACERVIIPLSLKMHSEMSSAKFVPFCSGLIVFKSGSHGDISHTGQPVAVGHAHFTNGAFS